MASANAGICMLLVFSGPFPTPWTNGGDKMAVGTCRDFWASRIAISTSRCTCPSTGKEVISAKLAIS